jgi:hippurate hydrolase
MAGVDQLDVTFRGAGGHGSTPQMAIDPVVMAARAAVACQTVVSRNLDPQASAVPSVTSIGAGRDDDVIPDTAVVWLYLRSATPELRELLTRRIDEVSEGVAIAAGVEGDQDPIRLMKGRSGPLVNDRGLVGRTNPSLAYPSRPLDLELRAVDPIASARWTRPWARTTWRS